MSLSASTLLCISHHRGWGICHHTGHVPVKLAPARYDPHDLIRQKILPRLQCKWCCAPPITSYLEKHSAQESFPESVLISASVWLYLILIFSKNIILRLDCRLFCVSHLYLPFHFYLSPLFFWRASSIFASNSWLHFQQCQFLLFIHSFQWKVNKTMKFLVFYQPSLILSISHFISCLFFSTCFSL